MRLLRNKEEILNLTFDLAVVLVAIASTKSITVFCL